MWIKLEKMLNYALNLTDKRNKVNSNTYSSLHLNLLPTFFSQN